MSDRSRHPHIERAWLARLRERQLNASLGWSRSDADFGGWGYSPAIPRKPAAGEMRGLGVESNLSATVFALGALRVSKVPSDEQLWQDALVFVDRCQNFADDPKQRDARFDDGGFVFKSSADGSLNKAGLAGVDRLGRERFHSYGSMTADGARALLACGRAQDHPRVLAARQWLIRHFDATRNPGTFQADREFIRDSSYYYWCWSIAHALTRLDVREIKWESALAEELIKRQRSDGSWKNDASAVKEDDPLVATPFAAAAMVICYDRLYRR
jgi:squalene-hopene/tetraprenyl-beta-curcumene cyclase